LPRYCDCDCGADGRTDPVLPKRFHPPPLCEGCAARGAFWLPPGSPKRCHPPVLALL